MRGGAPAVLTLALLSAPAVASNGAYDFWLSTALVEKLVGQNTLFFPMKLEMKARSSVHALKSDCELHVAGDPVDAADKAGPPAVVVEPPNLCKNKPAGGGKWEKWFDDNVIGETCTVTGFPRIYDEHLVGDETPTNPHHMLEIHPALKIKCGAAELDATPFLAYHPGMSEIQPSSAAKCFDTQLWVRKNDAKDRYEFKTNRPKNCGNFASFEMSVFTEWIRALPNGGHSAIVRVRPIEGGPTTLKIYTYPGTAEDTELAGFMGSADPHHGTFYHGMTTFDYFAIQKAVTDQSGNFLDLDDWTEVPFPMALVVFGAKDDPDPND